MHFLILGVKWGFWAMTLVQTCQKVKQGFYRRGRLSSFQKKVSAKILAHWIGVQGASNLVKKNENTPLFEPVPGEPLAQNKKFFLFEPRRLAASVEGLNNSLAITAGEL